MNITAELSPLFEYDRTVRLFHPVFCGIDEAGRGPLAGDVYAAAVILDNDTVIEGLNDSKKLTEKKREELFDEIISTAKELQCIKIEWKCLSWNTPAQKFYHSIGGSADPEWLTYTLDLRKD